MIKNARFIQMLLKEMSEWVDLGLITQQQKLKIENHYSDAPSAADSPVEQNEIKTEKPQAKERINLSRVIIGLATLCLAIGIIIFYASNWRKMPPSLKLAQIFVLILSTYGGAYWFLQAERRFSLVGRALLLLGMISYGTGIMLVAQIYHISSHPTNGLLAWAVGAFAISLLMREKSGIILSMALFIIWDIWEYSYFGNPGYLFGVPVLITAWLSWKDKNSRGMTASALLFAGWFLQLAFYAIENYATDGPAGYILIGVYIISGAFMQRYGDRFKKIPEYKHAGTIILITGWIAYALPLFQIDHLNPSTSYSIILWASMILAVSVILKDKKGYYIAAALYFIWSVSSAIPAYGYIIPVIVIAVLFYMEKDTRGLALSAASLIYYYYIPTVKLIPEETSERVLEYIIVMLQFPLAAVLVTAGKSIYRHPILGSAGKVFTIAGWFSLLIPFVAISWPMNMQNLPLLMKFGVLKIHAIEYMGLTLASMGGLFILHRKRENITLITPVIIFSFLVFFLPFNHTSTRMITLHLGAVGFIFLLLYYSFLFNEGKTFEKKFAFIFSISLLVIKGSGFIGFSAFDEKFKLAYLIGFILFVTVCFLINRLVNEILTGKGIEYPVRFIDGVSAAGVWISIYLASFEVEAQKSIFSAESIVIKMILIFVVLSVLLYVIMFKKMSGERIILFLSLIIFISSGITLFTAGPGVPWEIYSITFNLLLFITSAVFMYYSTIVQSKKILNFATAGIIIHVFTRYFDLFWDMFSGSLLFIITGILGLAGGYILEKKRKNLTEMIEAESGENQERVK
ncbi:MAG: hypothetical protein CVV49_02825 [Spirochaetae bacterium HGW-Spirochaetae-5]|nr:MAG: hypothetical protein CVV49_02825 [Spirochaetae bacterium HGW-Spirochaetae-5]